MNCKISGVPKGTPESKEARLTYRSLGYSAEQNLSLTEIQLLTGRHHQIRVQFSHAGFPLCGDQKYNPDAPVIRGENVALCAFRLTFLHPATKKKLTFSCTPSGKAFENFTLSTSD